MRTVILTVGPRGSGKSTFCKKVIQLDSNIMIVSRDEIIKEHIGTTEIGWYSDIRYVLDEMWEKVKALYFSNPNLTMILDTWNGSFYERSTIIEKLRILGVDIIIAWYFVTPRPNVTEWFWNKPEIIDSDFKETRYQRMLQRRQWKIFHKDGCRIDIDGFNAVITINPLVCAPEQVLSTMQTSLIL